MNNVLVYLNISFFLALFATEPVKVNAASQDVQPASQDSSLSAKTPGKQAVAIESVLDRFRTHTGPRTPLAMAALFTAPVAPEVLQTPAIVLSDGATTVRITTLIGSLDRKSPNIASNEAQLISIEHHKADEWEIIALPSVGTMIASLVISNDTDTRVIPLTVAPALPKEIDLSEMGFATFLRESSFTKQSQFDLNNDGRCDYMDDYIFTANYLAGSRHTATDQGVNQLASPNPSASDVPGEQQTSPVQGAGELLLPEVAGHPTTSQGTSNSQQGSTSYQQNQATRIQRLREQRDRMKSPVVTPTQ